ncbi:MAG: hypothetical protein MPN21_12045 [Thermoanaerobaculia bacterium]|nr:hypothetical protein [Thermoanaerobaculia bacterium]
MAENTGSGTNAIKILGEGLVTPGASLLIDGEVKRGIAHVAAGLFGKILFGGVGWGLAAANSFSNSVSGKHLHQHFISQKDAE